MKERRRPAAPPPSNRRREIRARLPHLATVFTERRAIGPCVVEDLSAGGVRLVTDAALRKGQLLSVMADLPGKRALVLRARVTRVERRRPGEHVVGLSFVELTAEDVSRIRQMVTRHLAETAPTLFFFDTSEDGCPKRIVLADGEPLVLPVEPIASAG